MRCGACPHFAFSSSLVVRVHPPEAWKCVCLSLREVLNLAGGCYLTKGKMRLLLRLWFEIKKWADPSLKKWQCKDHSPGEQGIQSPEEIQVFRAPPLPCGLMLVPTNTPAGWAGGRSFPNPCSPTLPRESGRMSLQNQASWIWPLMFYSDIILSLKANIKNTFLTVCLIMNCSNFPSYHAFILVLCSVTLSVTLKFSCKEIFKLFGKRLMTGE